MKTKPADKLESEFLRLQGILNDIKTSLMNLLPEESALKTIVTANGDISSATGTGASISIGRNDTGLALRNDLFNFLNDKPSTKIVISSEKPVT